MARHVPRFRAPLSAFGRILESTVFSERPKYWQERQAIYVIAVPAHLRRQAKGVSAHPAVLFAKSAPLGDP